MAESRIKTNRAQCKSCNEVIESFHRHDFKFCKCKTIFVDGGKSYLRRGGEPAAILELSEFEEVEQQDEPKNK
jgi:hypothetical protein